MSDTTNPPAAAPENTEGGPVAQDFKANLTSRVQRNRNMYIRPKPQQREGILATARPGLTDGMSGQLTPETIVKHGGVEMPLRQAERLGLVKRDGSGDYQDAKLSNEAPAPEEQPASGEGSASTPDNDGETSAAFLPAEDEAEFVSMVNVAHSHGITPGSLIGQYLANPNDLPASVKAIAEKRRMDVPTLKAQVDRVAGAFALQVANRMQAQGVSYDEVAAWEAKNVSDGEAKRGRLRLALHGDMSYFDNLCRAYKSHTVPLQHKAGVIERETRDPTNGQKVTLVKVPGYPEMRAETAARMGLI